MVFLKLIIAQIFLFYLMVKKFFLKFLVIFQQGKRGLILVNSNIFLINVSSDDSVLFIFKRVIFLWFLFLTVIGNLFGLDNSTLNMFIPYWFFNGNFFLITQIFNNTNFIFLWFCLFFVYFYLICFFLFLLFIIKIIFFFIFFLIPFFLGWFIIKKIESKISYSTEVQEELAFRAWSIYYYNIIENNYLLTNNLSKLKKKNNMFLQFKKFFKEHFVNSHFVNAYFFYKLAEFVHSGKIFNMIYRRLYPQLYKSQTSYLIRYSILSIEYEKLLKFRLKYENILNVINKYGEFGINEIGSVSDHTIAEKVRIKDKKKQYSMSFKDISLKHTVKNVQEKVKFNFLRAEYDKLKNMINDNSFEEINKKKKPTMQKLPSKVRWKKLKLNRKKKKK